MATSDYGLQITRSDGRVLFDSRTWGPCLYDWLDTSSMQFTQVGNWDQVWTADYPAAVTVIPLSVAVDNITTPNGLSFFPTIRVDATPTGSRVTLTFTDGARHCQFLVVGK